jgi:uncharacterized protein (DUF58 family)
MASPFFDETFLRRLESLALLYRRLAVSQVQGERRSARRGQSVEFSDFRPYVPGDDFRRIDWNAYARLERLFLKLFVEEQDLTVHILIDASQSMDWGEPNKLAFTARLAGALGYVALASLDRVTVTALGHNGPAARRHLPPVRGKRSALSLFEFLISVSDGDAAPARSKSPGAPAAALGVYGAATRQPGTVLLFSDLLDDGWQPALNRLAGRGFEVSVLHILSPDELRPELEGDFRLIDSETGQGVELTANFDTLRRYQQALAGWQASWRSFCTARSMHYLAVDTSQPLEELLFARLPQQGVLR